MALSGKTYSVDNCAVIIMAAGMSSRLGSPKQLLQYRGKSLLQHTIDIAKQASAQTIIVVLGANFELICRQTDLSDTHPVKNEDWDTGIASSISCGINALQNVNPITDAAILMVCDQPFITSSLLNELVLTQKASDKPIVASQYAETVGIPALFHKNFFPQLLKLTGDSGAKKIMQQYPDLLFTVPFSPGNIDIDTLEDFEKL